MRITESSEEDHEKTLAFSMPVFLILSDCVIFTLRTVTEESKHQQVIAHKIYDPFYACLYLLLTRLILSFEPKYWLCMMAIVFTMTILIAYYDLSETFYIRQGVVRDEVRDVIELYKEVP